MWSITLRLPADRVSSPKPNLGKGWMALTVPSSGRTIIQVVALGDPFSRQDSTMAELTLLEQGGLLTGVVSGIGGLALGVVNTIRQQADNKPRLRVRFAINTVIDRTFGLGGPIEENVGLVEIANTGRVPSTPSVVGIHATRHKHLFVVSPDAFDGGPFPRELQPGRTCLLKFNVGSLREAAQGQRWKRPFVTSQIGDTFYGRRSEARKFQGVLRRLRIESLPGE
jgi:hypothetical protein